MITSSYLYIIMGNAPNHNSPKIDSVHPNDASQFILVLLQKLLCEFTFIGTTASP